MSHNLPSNVTKIGRDIARSSFASMSDRLPIPVASRVDQIVDRYRRWHGPFNGQAGRLNMVREIAHHYSPGAFIETGSFLGTTTVFMASLLDQAEIWTVELSRRYFSTVSRRTRNHRNVHARQGDSRRVLSDLANDSHLIAMRVFVYLDAHWYSEVPLREELEIIRDNWSDYVVMIDDFEVDGDAGYEFDCYGEGGRCLTPAILPPLHGCSLYYPTLPSVREDPPRRGCCVIASPTAAPVMDQLLTLRRGRIL